MRIAPNLAAIRARILSVQSARVLRELRFSCLSSKRRELALLCAIDLSLQTSDRTSEIFCIRLSLAAKSRFPAGETDLNGGLLRPLTAQLSRLLRPRLTPMTTIASL